MQFKALNDIHTHFEVAGDFSDVPVVFLNSLGTDFRIWNKLLPHLSDGLRFIRSDMRGHGLTEAPGDAYRMEELVADAVALMDHLQLRGAVVIGLSIGGVIAQGIACQRPDLVRAMVLSNTAAKIGSPQMWEDRIATVNTAGIDELAPSILERWFSHKFRKEKTEDLAGWRLMLTRTPVAGYVGCCKALAVADYRESTSQLRLPVLALVGSEDGATPPDLVRQTATSINGCRFEILEGAGHLPCIETPEEMGKLIGHFLKGNGIV